MNTANFIPNTTYAAIKLLIMPLRSISESKEEGGEEGGVEIQQKRGRKVEAETKTVQRPDREPRVSRVQGPPARRIYRSVLESQ